MKGSSGRKLRRAVLQPWKQRKVWREAERKQAAFDLEMQRKIAQALRERRGERRDGVLHTGGR